MKTSVISSIDGTITNNCGARNVRANPSTPVGEDNEQPTTKLAITISAPQHAAAATAGVARRSRSARRTHNRKSQRSLSRNSTASELNCSIAQRIAMKQAIAVTATTICEYCTAGQ